MTSSQNLSHSREKNGVDVDLILEVLGTRGRYQTIQLMLCIFACFLVSIVRLENVFTGYQPDYQCNEVDNFTQLAENLPDDVTNYTLHDVQYHRCSIDVTVNISNASSTHSLPCVAGVNFSMPAYTSFLTEWTLVCDKAGQSQLIQSGIFGGQVAGNLVFSVLADRYGRKNVYICCTLCTLVALCTTAFVPSYYLFLAGKIIVGFFSVGMVQAAYTSFTELLPQQWRCLASVMDGVLWGMGCLFLAAAGYWLQGVSWRYLSLVNAAPYVFSLVLPWFLDESLRWLLATGRIKEAEKILKKACKMNGKDFRDIQMMLPQQIFTSGNPNQENDNEEDATNERELTDEKKKIIMEDETLNLVAMKSETTADDLCVTAITVGLSHRDHQDYGGASGRRRRSISEQLTSQTEPPSAKYTLLDLCRHRVVFLPFVVTVFVWMTDNLYYYAVMLGSAKLAGNRFLNFALLNLQDIPSIPLALFLMRRYNRRPLSFAYGMLAGSSLLLSVGLASLGGKGLTLTLATAAQYTGMFFLTGSYILLFVYYMEVYPTSMRAIGTGMAAMVIKVTDMGAPFLLVWGEETPWAPGVLVGCMCCLASLSIWLLPETRHRKLPDTIEEIQAWKMEGRSVQPTMPDARG